MVVTENLNDYVKVYGTYDLVANDCIFGRNSGTVATVNSVVENEGIFKIDYSLTTNKGLVR